jgi:homoserine O-acetyltransferase/O-succinyltransferase
MFFRKALSVFVVFVFCSTAFSQGIQKFGNIGNLTLENGAVIQNCSIGYRTFGKLNENKSNAVIYPTWFGGTSAELSGLIGPNKLIDSSKYYVIALDAIGNGISTSPSNSETQKDENFPVLTIHDMVESEYVLLTSNLGIKHLYAAIGGSMGSMQTLEWLVAYPDFIDKAIAYVCSPKSSSHDLLMWNLHLNIIESGKKCGQSEKEIIKNLDILTDLTSNTTAYLSKHPAVEDFPKYLASFNNNTSKTFTCYNHVSQIKAMLAHDISKKFGGSMKETAKHIKAKLLMIVNRQDNILDPRPAIEFSKLANADILLLDNERGHLGISPEMKKCSKAIATFLEK